MTLQTFPSGVSLATGKRRIHLTRKLTLIQNIRRRLCNKRTTRPRHIRGNRTMVNMTTQIRRSTIRPPKNKLSLISRVTLIIKLTSIHLSTGLITTYLRVIRRTNMIRFTQRT